VLLSSANNSAPKALLQTARQVFGTIPDTPGNAIALADHLMSGLALFGLKYPSLLQFEHDCREETTRANLKALYGIDRAPSDTRFRERLDALDPSHLRPLYKALFAELQRGKGLEGFAYLDDHYLISIDGTGYFSSQTIHCAQCAEKHHRNGTTTYYHQMLGAVLVHPDCAEVFPLAPEPILKPDGAKKNDCERNAAKRLLTDLRREHPHLKLIVVEDALASNGPHIRHLQALESAFYSRRQTERSHVLVRLGGGQRADCREELQRREGVPPPLPLPQRRAVERRQLRPRGELPRVSGARPRRQRHPLLLGDRSPVEDSNLMTLMRGARARWKIENETFNTLKNQGYHFEHNFGHGNQHLGTVLMHLMMLAFLIDQIQQRCCRLFQAALTAAKSKTRLWRKLRNRFDLCLIPTWEVLYRSIIAPPRLPLPHDTS
jgi:hypothetical protein